jgi:hypothetical protein
MAPENSVEALRITSPLPPSCTVPPPASALIAALPVWPEMSNVAPPFTVIRLVFDMSAPFSRASVPAATVVAPV